MNSSVFRKWTAICCFGGLMACGTDPAVTIDAATAADGGAVDSATADGEDGAKIDIAGDQFGSDAGDVAPGDATGPGVLVARPLRFEDDLHAAWGSNADDVWVVGAKGRLLHWNGHVLAPRASGTSQDLNGIAGRGPNDVWMAGDGVLLHWDGQQLADVTPKGVLLGVYRAVTAPTDGSTVLVAGDKGLVIRLLGDGTWKQEMTASSLDLQAIAAADAAVVWAVGPQGQALKLSGGSWTPTQMPKTNAKGLNAVAAGPAGRFFAAGDGGYLAATDQSTWSATLANDPKTRNLYALWAPSDDEAWALGKDGALLHYIGKKWELEDIAGTYMKLRSFRGVWGTKGGTVASRKAFAFGEGGAGVAYDNGQWLDFRAETTGDLRAVAAAADGSVYACGQAGLLLRAASAGAPFYDLAAAVTAADLNDVTADGGVWAVGTGGVAVHGGTVGDSKVEVVPGGKDLFGIARYGSDLMIAVGDGGAIAVRSLMGGTWSPQASTTQLPLRGVAASGINAFAVGDFGTILRGTGAGADKWSAEDSGVIEDLQRVIAWGDGEAMAIGANGLILLRQQGKWSTVFQAPGSHLYGAARKADGTLIAVGFGGTVVVGKVGGTFKKLDGGPSWMLGVAAASGGVVAVGSSGSVFTVAEILP